VAGKDFSDVCPSVSAQLRQVIIDESEVPPQQKVPQTEDGPAPQRAFSIASRYATSPQERKCLGRADGSRTRRHAGFFDRSALPEVCRPVCRAGIDSGFRLVSDGPCGGRTMGAVGRRPGSSGGIVTGVVVPVAAVALLAVPLRRRSRNAERDDAVTRATEMNPESAGGDRAAAPDLPGRPAVSRPGVAQGTMTRDLQKMATDQVSLYLSGNPFPIQCSLKSPHKGAARMRSVLRAWTSRARRLRRADAISRFMCVQRGAEAVSRVYEGADCASP